MLCLRQGELGQARNARQADTQPGANDSRGFSPEPFHEPPGLRLQVLPFSPCDDRLGRLEDDLLCVRLFHGSCNGPDKAHQFSCYGGNRHIGMLVFTKNQTAVLGMEPVLRFP
ncbi:hypothetical protein D3C74_385720 [compost metagenome]